MMARNQNGSTSSPSATISIARSVSPAAPRPISPNAVRLSNNSEYRHPATAGEKSKYAGTKSAAAAHRPTFALGCCNRRRKTAQETAATASTSALVAPIGAAFAASTLKLRISAASIIAPTLPVRTAQSSQFPVIGPVVGNGENARKGLHLSQRITRATAAHGAAAVDYFLTRPSPVIRPQRFYGLSFEGISGQVLALFGASQRRNSKPSKSAATSPSSIGPNLPFL